jgi:hypothetical protein
MRQAKSEKRASQAGTGVTQQPGNVGMSKLGGTLTKIFKRVVPLCKGSDLQKCPGTYKEALTHIQIAEKHCLL